VSLLVGIVVCLVAAVLPTLIFVQLFYWADRYEREPKWLVTVAFLWGAIPAVVGSVVAELILGIPLATDAPSLGTQVVESALFAPVVEELAKGIALLGIFLWFRHEFDGVLDGLIHGALIGFGFAMTENLLYFIGAYAEGGWGGLTAVFFLRVVVFGLNHSFYTGLTGIGFGLARTARSRSGRWFWPLLGLSLAMLAHSLHNLGASVASVTAAGLLLSLVVAMGGFVIIIMTILLSWQQERSHIRSELAAEVGTLLSEEEYRTLLGRWRNPLRKGKNERAHANRMQQLVQLALRKQQLRRLAPQEEPGLIAEIERLRTTLAQPAA
jgi:protease PrsW